ncbi:hypothetical protein DPEC_G00354820 [Dallia pectoralis]|uniref:Uncharacterized protein n=1 Tax=Dallia pectoralis TaxID=75939 RepID=A0ACC2EZB5_DALPE|nr:hypothetical protein DPEC_G00354820 [Dallia pectoralis]
MDILLITLILGAVGALANKEVCVSGKFTTTGECCRQCEPGQGVLKPCGATQTVCTPCLDSETFSENYSHTDTCRPCTRCEGILRMRSPCTDSEDAVCICDYGYYLNEISNRCESCTKCPLGQGMLFACEHERDTVCEECIRDTYSDQESSREPCLPCTICDEDGDMEIQPCNPSKDTVCQGEILAENSPPTENSQPCSRCVGLACSESNDVCICDDEYYLDKNTNRCESCTKCPLGQGMLFACENERDTVCEECIRDTYSDQESSREPCLPCTICDEDGDMEIQPCNPSKDTVCPDLNSSLPSFTNDDRFHYISTEITTTTPTSATTSSIRFIGPGLNENLIPIYCSILAAVVVGLVAFIIFKRWNSCKQNKQGANNCTANQNQTPSPEAEKLHSDSGISVDSQSLQEQHGQGQTLAQTVVTVDEDPCLLLPLHTREEVEKLLYRGKDMEGCHHSTDSDWCSLAGLLGYQEERIASFCQEDHPVCALLSDWANQECASVDTLCTALRKINREDIAQTLTLSPAAVKPTATSTV